MDGYIDVGRNQENPIAFVLDGAIRMGEVISRVEMENVGSSLSKTVLWVSMKAPIRGETIATDQKRKQSQSLSLLAEEINSLRNRLRNAVEDRNDIKQNLDVQMDEFNEIPASKTAGAMVRARAHWTEHYLQNTGTFSIGKVEQQK